MSGHIDFVCAQATAFSSVVRPEALLEVLDLLLEDARALRRPEQALGLEAVVARGGALRRLYCHSSAPLRQT